MPSSGILILTTLALSVIYYAVTWITSYYRLAHIPGPKVFALSVFPLLKVHLSGAIYTRFGEFNEKYGPLVRIAPNTLLTSDPDQWRKMSAPRSPYLRSKWYYAMRMNPGMDNVLSTRDEKVHDELRKRMAAGYSGKENVTLERDIDDCITELIHLIENRYVTTDGKVKFMDLAQKIQFFTADVMSKLSFDAKFHDLRDDNDNLDYIQEVYTNFPVMFCFSVIPKFVDFMTNTGILSLMAPTANSKMGFGRILGIAQNQVGSRFNQEGKAEDLKDMMGSFLRHGLTQQDCERESVLQIVAGTDTSATGIRATMLGIMTNPRVYAKITAELDAAVASGKIPSDPDQVVSDAQSKELPYVQACIKEGLRWYPPIAGLLAKEVPAGGDTIGGYFVPEGTTIGYSAHGIHHSTALFGPDAHCFRPERWLLRPSSSSSSSPSGDEPSADHLHAMERNNELVFGYGRHQCLGKPVAMIELNKIFIALLQRFEFALADPFKPWETFCAGIHLQRNMWVVVKRREREGG